MRSHRGRIDLRQLSEAAEDRIAPHWGRGSEQQGGQQGSPHRGRAGAGQRYAALLASAKIVPGQVRLHNARGSRNIRGLDEEMDRAVS